MTPIMAKSIKRVAGPPVRSAEPEPTNNPAPILPPAKRQKYNHNHAEKRRTDGNHVQVTRLERLIELIVSICQSALLEGFWRAAQATHERQRFVTGIFGDAIFDIVRV